MDEQSNRQVRVFPVETRRGCKDKSGNKITLTRQWQPDRTGRFFPNNLSVTQLKTALAKSKVKTENVQLTTQDNCIVYRYTGRPLILFNLKNGHFYTLTTELDTHGKEALQQQAHILTNILKQNKLTNATQTGTTPKTNARKTLNQLKTYKK
ncbi:MAG: hypothetical protein NWF04_02630 [Candidatus Bathyarchaeota archaeon]|nr:hypothetical protein [Candidatus Bathyarchaeota archaeon]